MRKILSYMIPAMILLAVLALQYSFPSQIESIRAKVLRKVKFDENMLTEDIDSTVRGILAGYRFVHDRSIVSTELAPVTLSGLWYQRKRWSQGWFQCSMKHQMAMWRTPNLNFPKKFIWTTLLSWRVFFDVVSSLLFPVVFAFWLNLGRVAFPVNAYILFVLVFTILSGPYQALVAYKNAALPRAPVWEYLFYSFFCVALYRVQNSGAYGRYPGSIDRGTRVDHFEKGESMKCAKILVILFFAVLVSSSSPLLGGEPPQDPLEKARKLVEQRDYGSALEIYDGLNDQLSKDPNLLIEWARVNTYANRHSQAIAIFERVRKEYPEKGKGILRELGDQYKWNGRLDRSIEIYREGLSSEPGNLQIEMALAQALAWDKQRKEAVQAYDQALALDPKNIGALLGKAEVLSWDGKLEKARAIYDSILKIEPQNIDALNGIARLCVWQGYHRLGIKRYRQILKDHPANPEAMEGIAFAYHWDRQEGKALEAAKALMTAHPDRHAGGELYDQIKNIKKPHALQGNRFSDDRNHLYIAAEKVHVGTYVGDATIIGAAYEWYLYRQPGKAPLNANRGGFDISHKLNEYLEANSYLYLAKYSAEGFTPFTTNTWLTFKPNDIWRLDGGYDRETFEDITSMNRKVIADSGSISFDLTPNRFWLISSKYKRSHYNDSNDQNTIFSKIEYRLWQKPYLKLYYNFYYSDWANQTQNGYFNPQSIFSNTGGIYGSTHLWKKLFGENQLSMGYEVQKPKQSRPTYYASTSLNYALPRNVSLFGRAEYFLAKDTNPSKRYSKGTLWFGLTYSFGGEPGRQHEAQQAQRPLV